LLAKRNFAAATIAAVLLVAGCGGGTRDHPARASASDPDAAVGPVPRQGGLPRATVTVDPVGPARIVPRSFFGISTEYWAIPLFGRHMREFERALSLLRVPGNGPFVLRIGGDSADHSVFDLNVGRLPRGVFDLRPSWFHRTSLLASDLRAHVLMDLNLVTDQPAMAGRWARAAMTELPRGSVVGFEIGNEPDLYSRRYWATVFSPLGLLTRDLPVELTPQGYVSLFGTYDRVLAMIAPHVGLVGPVVAYPALALPWIATLLRGPHPGLRLISAHEYPYSACETPLSPLFPTISRILSEGATAGMAASVKPAVLLAHRAGFPFRLTEANSVTCGGLPGVSDTFATALWAPDAMFELLRTGANGVNVHVRAYADNAAFGLGTDGIVAHPLMYGLILFTRMLGAGARLVPATLEAPGSLHLKAWAVRVGARDLRVLVINKGDHTVRVRLHLPASAPATVERLLAPSPRALSGVTLGGQHLGIHETWLGRRSTPTIRRAAGGVYALSVPATSAALVRVQTEARAR
jgi:hypothetical protein